MTTLRVLTLNAWGGRECEPLLDMLRRLAADGAEVFCLQEVYDTVDPIPREVGARIGKKVQPDLLKLLRDALPGYESRFVSNSAGFVFAGEVHPQPGARYGNAIFVRSDLPIEEYRALPIVSRRYETSDPTTKVALYSHNLQIVRMRMGERSVEVANYHGIPTPADKLDTSTRLLQSERLLRALPNADVVCGDFNLDLNTTSVAMLEKRWHNLIREFDIPTTRSDLNPYKGTSQEQRYADYVFLADGVIAERFGALDDQVSDHLGLWLEASMNVSGPPHCGDRPPRSGGDFGRRGSDI